MVDYPLPRFHVQLDWGGSRIGFCDISGLDAETEIVEYRDGASPDYSKTEMPGLQKSGNITPKGGVFRSDNEFFDWWKAVRMNTVERRDLTISLLNEEHEPMMVRKVANVRLTRIQATDSNADGNETAIEAIEPAHEGVRLARGLPG